MDSDRESIKAILDGAHYYSDARTMISVSKFGSYIVLVIGLIVCAVGLAAAAGERIDLPFFGNAGALPILPGLILVWLAVSGLAAAQTRQANLDAAEAALLSLLIMKQASKQP